MKTLPVTADGQTLNEIDHYEDGGGKVPDRIVERAGIVGALRLLEEIAARDENPDYRRQARSQANALKHLIRRRVGVHGEVISDAEMLGGNFLRDLRKARKEQKQLPPATLVIENGSDS